MKKQVYHLPYAPVTRTVPVQYLYNMGTTILHPIHHSFTPLKWQPSPGSINPYLFNKGFFTSKK
jgi:hypothetical protein